MNKLYIYPLFSNPDQGDGGIRRVVEAQKKYLPRHGFTVVDSLKEADLIACHAGAYVDPQGRPLVAHCHGLYWADDNWGSDALSYNNDVKRVLMASSVQTVPSQWVHQAVSRAFLINPRVIPHGIDPDEWGIPHRKKDYILWNKARPDVVCSPREIEELARRLPGRHFVSTFGTSTPNLKVVGRLPYDQMKLLTQESRLYLATARETFGIGTLEALASGTPVVGWDYGGQSEIILQGKTGLLVPYGDFDALIFAIETCLKNWESMSRAAYQDAISRWKWETIISQYARVYREALKIGSTPVKVSVIVPVYNMEKYLDECLQSIQNQTEKNFECIIYDDVSQDSSFEIAKTWAEKDKRFKAHRGPKNRGVAQARNSAMAISSGKYILPVDPDDLISKDTLRLLSDPLDRDPSIHITYGSMTIFHDSDFAGEKGTPWPRDFDWYAQMSHSCQLPYCSMFRRAVYENSGGYRSRIWLTEDADFWCRVSSLGYRPKKVTSETTLRYRIRSGSRIQTPPGEGDWTIWYPWRITKSEVGHPHPRADLVPLGASAEPDGLNLPAWRIFHHNEPKVSIIIPVGEGHESYVIDALDSVLSQSFQDWECILVNDMGHGLTREKLGAPWAKLIETPGKTGPAYARNLGAKSARGEVLLFLDADDLLMPWAIEDMYDVYLQTGAVVYTDWVRNAKDPRTKYEVVECPDFVCGEVLGQMRHAVTCMIPRSTHLAVGGFDAQLKGWEDWDYFIALQAKGICSTRLPEPCFIYRMNSGTERMKSLSQKPELLETLRRKWDRFYSKEETMGCSGCGQRRSLPRKSRLVSVSAPELSARNVEISGAVLLEYTGPGDGKMTFRGRATGTTYRIQKGETKYFDPRDAQAFLSLSDKFGPYFREIPDDRSPTGEKLLPVDVDAITRTTVLEGA